MRAYIEEALRAQAEGSALPFATLEAARAGRSAAPLRRDRPEQPRVEIGWTGSGDLAAHAANTEAKYLMLRHAFDTMAASASS